MLVNQAGGTFSNLFGFMDPCNFQLRKFQKKLTPGDNMLVSGLDPLEIVSKILEV